MENISLDDLSEIPVTNLLESDNNQDFLSTFSEQNNISNVNTNSSNNIIEVDNDQLKLDTITQIQDKMISQNMRDSELLHHNKEQFSINNEITKINEIDTNNSTVNNEINDINNNIEISTVNNEIINDINKNNTTLVNDTPVVTSSDLDNNGNIINETQIGGSDDDKTKKLSNFSIGEKVQIMMMDETHDYHQKEGIVICYSPQELTIENTDEKLLKYQKISFRLENYNFNKKDKVKTINTIEETTVKNYIELHGFDINRKVILHAKETTNPLHLKKGTIVNLTEGLHIDLEDIDVEPNQVVIDLEYGLSLNDEIEKIELLIDNPEEDLLADFEELGIHISEEEGELIEEIQEIPENEKTYSIEEEFDDLFQGLLNFYKKDYKIEEQINNWCQQYVTLKKKSIERMENTNSYQKNTSFSHLINLIKNGSVIQSFA